MRYYKGLHFVLEAVKGTGIHLVIGGAGGMEQKLRARVQREDLDNVHCLGFVSDEDKIALLHLCRGFVLPSHLRSEAFGIALLEAAAYGKPLISCEIGTGTSFVNIDGETGMVVESSSPEAFRNAMHFLLDNPARAAEFGKNAEKRYHKLFTAKKQAEAYHKLYREMLGV